MELSREALAMWSSLGGVRLSLLNTRVNINLSFQEGVGRLEAKRLTRIGASPADRLSLLVALVDNTRA